MWTRSFNAWTLIGLFILCGCGKSDMTMVVSVAAKNGHHRKMVYSPLFSSNAQNLTTDVKFRVSVVNTRKVEPVTYWLAKNLGMLSSDDLQSNSTAVVHFKNDSQGKHQIALQKIRISNDDYAIQLPSVTLKSRDRFNTQHIDVVIPTYSLGFDVELFYNLDGQDKSKVFSLRRQTVEEYTAKMNRVPE